jgi:surface protein
MSTLQLRYTTTATNTQIGIYLAGSGSASITWGDASSNTYTLGAVTQYLHTYGPSGNYLVDISGTNITQLGNGSTVATGIQYLKSVPRFGSVGLTSLNGAFRGATGLPGTAGIMPSTLPGTVTNLDWLFFGASSFNDPSINGWDVSGVTSMQNTLSLCAFNQNISGWNVSKCTNFTSTFNTNTVFNNGGASGTSTIPLNWTLNTTSNIKMSSMFFAASAFNQDLSWNTTKVTAMENIFQQAYVFNRNISTWNVSNSTNFSSMFQSATAFNNGAAALTTNTAPLTWTLNTSGALKTINMTSMFNGANSFSQDISTWNIKNVSTMATMFTLNTTSMTNDLFDAMLTEWGITDASVNVPKTPFTFSTIKYTLDGSAGLAALRAAPYSWTVTANLVTYTPTITVADASFIFNYAVASTSPVTGHGYTVVNTASPSTVLSRYTAIAGDTSYNFTGVTISTTGNVSLMITDASINAIVDVVQLNNISPSIQLQYTTTTINTTIGIYLGGDSSGTAVINWGDSSLDTINPLPGTVTQYSHTYAAAGTYIVGISSTTNIIQLGNGSTAATGIIRLKSVLSFGSSGLTSLSGAFNGATGLTNLGCMPTTLPSTVKDLSYMFYGSNINDPSMNNWDVSGVTNMSYMFQNSTAFNQNIGGWNTGSVVDMTNMFYSSRFNQNISAWNVANVTSLASMFQGAITYNNGGASGTSPLSWTNVNNAQNLSLMFSSISGRATIPFNQSVSGWSLLALTSAANMFAGGGFGSYGRVSFNNGGVPLSWTLPTTGTPNIDFTGMFYSDRVFSQDLSWNTINVTNMSSMFDSAAVFNSSSLSSWNVSNVVNTSRMFANSSLAGAAGTVAFNRNLSGWNLTSLTNASYMFAGTNYGATVFNNGGLRLSLTLKTTGTPNINMSYMFYTATQFNQDISWNTTNVTSMDSMFNTASSYNNGGQPINWTSFSNVNTMFSMFADAGNFNQNISNWNVSSVTNFDSMFYNASKFNNGAAALTTNTAPLTWSLNTTGTKIIDMGQMFNLAKSFSQDISSWNIKNVSDMTAMFSLNNTSMTSPLFSALLQSWSTASSIPSSVFFSQIKYYNTVSNNTYLNTLRNAPNNWNIGSSIASYTPTSINYGTTFTLVYTVASFPPNNTTYNLINNGSVIATYVYTAGNTSYTFTNVSLTGFKPNVLTILDVSGSMVIDIVTINIIFPCLKEGTKILTDKGYVPIEDLRKGDLVKTPVNDYKAVYMIGKAEIYNHSLPERVKHQLYKCSPENYPEVFEDVILTGCHSILVDDFANDEQRERTREVNGDLYVTRVNYGHMMGGKYRLPACADERAVVYEKEGTFTIYHIALENSNYYHNYGIYANGLLVETCSQRYLNELSHMDSIE